MLLVKENIYYDKEKQLNFLEEMVKTYNKMEKTYQKKLETYQKIEEISKIEIKMNEYI